MLDLWGPRTSQPITTQSLKGIIMILSIICIFPFVRGSSFVSGFLTLQTIKKSLILCLSAVSLEESCLRTLSQESITARQMPGIVCHSKWWWTFYVMHVSQFSYILGFLGANKDQTRAENLLKHIYIYCILPFQSM